MFYLHIGFSLFLVGIFILLDNYQKNNNGKKTVLKKISVILLLGYVMTLLAYGMPATQKNFNKLAMRTQEEKHFQKLNAYVAIKAMLSQVSNKLERRVSVLMDPNLYTIDSTPQFLIKRFFRDFLHAWKFNADIIIYNKKMDPNFVKKDKKSLQFVMRAYHYKAHVCNPDNMNDSCSYIAIQTAIKDVRIFMRKNVFIKFIQPPENK
ncbi:hypothetical protein ACFL49_00680 [Candidatus Omnitrophota bacterium]